MRWQEWLEYAGMALVVVGLALWRVPVAIAVAGVLMITVAELRSLHGTDR